MARPGIAPERPELAVRRGPVRPRDLLTDLGLVGLVAAVFFGGVAVARQWSAPLAPRPELDLDPARLPLYALYSFARGVAAYALSITFAIAYGKLATIDRRTERVLLPVLDVLQSIPVLSFLPGFVLALMGLFPSSNLGLELACVLAIFTGQVWNLAFSFHASLKAMPPELVEAAKLNGFGPLKRLFALEIPAAATGLVWNSMLSMAGGWFFLTVVEAFTLDGRDYRLPGLGSYMAAAVSAGDVGKTLAAIGTMAAMIIAADQLLWRPALVWAERFRLDDAPSGDAPTSWFHAALKRSPLGTWLRARASGGGRGEARTSAAAEASPSPATSPVGRAGGGAASDPATYAGDGLRDDAPDSLPHLPFYRRTGVVLAAKTLGSLAVLGGAVFAVVGAVALWNLLSQVDGATWLALGAALGLTSLRVLGALIAALIWTLPLGIAVGRSRRMARVLQPVIQIAASFPAPMLYPFVVPRLRALGVPPDLIASGLMMLGTAWYVLFNVAAGAAAAPNELREAASVFRIPRLKRLIVLDLAALFPFLITGLVTAAGGAWNASIVAESVAYPGGAFEVEGIGAWIARAFAHGDHPRLAAATVALATSLVVVNRLAWKPLQRLAATRFSAR